MKYVQVPVFDHAVHTICGGTIPVVKDCVLPIYGKKKKKKKPNTEYTVGGFLKNAAITVNTYVIPNGFLHGDANVCVNCSSFLIISLK